MTRKAVSLLRALVSAGDEPNVAYALLRIFVGVALITHGYGKLFGGLAGFGLYLENMGLPLPSFFAFMAAVAEFGGGCMLITGLFTRIFSFMVVATMSVAVFVAHSADPFAKKELALVYLLCALLFMLKGAGRYSLDRIFFGAISASEGSPEAKK